MVENSISVPRHVLYTSKGCFVQWRCSKGKHFNTWTCELGPDYTAAHSQKPCFVVGYHLT